METREKTQRLKGLVRKLVSPIIIAGSLTLPLLPFASTNSYADHKNDLKNLRDWYIINQGIKTTQEGLRGFHEYQFQEWIKRNHENYYRSNSRDNRENRNREENREELDPNKIPQTFVCNYYKDFNRNGKSSIDEFIGFNKSSYGCNESLSFGMYLPMKGIKGKKYSMKTFNPNGEFVYLDEGKFDREPTMIIKETSISEIINTHGEGTYAIAFYIDGKHWNTIPLDLFHKHSNANKEKQNLQPIEGVIVDPEKGIFKYTD